MKISRGAQIIAGLLLAFAVGSAIAGAEKANPRYVIQDDTVYDKKTDLTWQRCSVGQHWKKGIGCAGIVKTFSFDQAQNQRSGEWRVPSKEELSTLIDHRKADAKQKPTIDEEAFPDMDLASLAYWTSTPEGVSNGWDVYFGDGRVNFGGRSDAVALAVRLVRGGQ